MDNMFYINGKEVEAASAEEAFEMAGIEMPEDIRPYKGFVVQNFRWSYGDTDYSVEDFSPNGYRFFPEWPEADAYYNSLNEETIAAMGYEEVRVDLTQYGLGRRRVQKSKILMAQDKVAAD